MWKCDSFPQKGGVAFALGSYEWNVPRLSWSQRNAPPAPPLSSRCSSQNGCALIHLISYHTTERSAWLAVSIVIPRRSFDPWARLYPQYASDALCLHASTVKASHMWGSNNNISVRLQTECQDCSAGADKMKRSKSHMAAGCWNDCSCVLKADPRANLNPFSRSLC